MMLAINLLQTHLFARIRDEGGSRMNIATRLELCLNNECVAVYEGQWLDTHYWVRGASFLVFAGQKQLKVAGVRYSYDRHTELPDGMDRFDLSSQVFGHLLHSVHQASKGAMGSWLMWSANRELLHFLDDTRIIPDPFLLAFLASAEAERRVY